MRQVQCDVLVIGAGLAGCWAAVRAGEVAKRVVLIDIGKVSRCGQSSFSGADIIYPEPSDDLDAWQQEIVEKGQYLNDQDWVRIMLEELPPRLMDMGLWGLGYEKDEKGRIYRHGSINSVVRNNFMNSLQMMEVMRARLEGIGVTLLERVMITGLLTSDGELPTRGSVVGALGFHIRTGEAICINAGATIAASGAGGILGALGEGIAQSCQAGAEIFNMEFSRLFDEMCFEDKYLGIGVHMGTFRRLGMKLLNSDGERFMEKYFPITKEIGTGRREDVGLSIVSEGLQGKGPIYMDLRHLDEDGMNKLHTLSGTARLVRALEEDGFDFRKQPIKYTVTSGPLFVRIGGIKHNTYGETSLPGLYTAGQVGGYPAHGAKAGGGVNLALCCVEGYRAGEYAGRFAMEFGCKPIIQEQSKDLEKRMMRPLKMSSGPRATELLDEMHGFLSPAMVSIFRDATTIKKVLGRIADWKAKTELLRAEDYHDLVKVNRMAPYVRNAELIFTANLARQETRANNMRIDFPYKDNINWLKWIIQRIDNKGALSMKIVPVPLDRYPVRPEEYRKVQADFPYPKIEGVKI